LRVTQNQGCACGTALRERRTPIAASSVESDTT